MAQTEMGKISSVESFQTYLTWHSLVIFIAETQTNVFQSWNWELTTEEKIQTLLLNSLTVLITYL